MKAQGDEFVVFLLVGVGHHVATIGAVNGANTAEFLYLGGVFYAEGEIILTAVAHQLLKFSLALGHDCAAKDSGTKKTYKT